MKKILTLILALIMCLSLAACGEEAPEAVEPEAKVLKLALSQSLTAPQAQVMQKIADDFSAATDGRYKLELYADGQMGDDALVMEQVQKGLVHLALVPAETLEAYSPDFAVLSTPYLFNSVEHQKKVLESDILADLYSTTIEQGFAVLGSYAAAPMNLATVEAAAVYPNDVSALLTSTVNAGVRTQTIRSWGGVAIPMLQADVPAAVTNGTLDAAEVDYITYMDQKLYEAAPYYNISEHAMVPQQLVISNYTLSALTTDDQAALRKACSAAIAYSFDKNAERIAEYETAAQELSITVTNCDTASFRIVCTEVTSAVIGSSETAKALYDSIRAAG